MKNMMKNFLFHIAPLLFFTILLHSNNSDGQNVDVISLQNEASADNTWSIRAGCGMIFNQKTRGTMSTDRIGNIAGHLRRSSAHTRTGKQGYTASEIARFIRQTDGRMDFDDGSYINWNDENGVPGETVDWRLYGTKNFDLSSGTFRFTSSSIDSSLSKTQYDTISAENDDNPAVFSLEVSRIFRVSGNRGVNLSARVAMHRDSDELTASGRVYKETLHEANTYETVTFTESSWVNDSTLIWEDSHGAGIGDAVTSGPGAVLNADRIESQLSAVASTRSYENTVDATLSGETCFWEVGLFVRPWMELSDRLRVSGAVGILAVRSELDFNSAIIKNGEVFASFSESDDDWTTLLAAGCGFGFSITDNLEISAEWLYRFGDDKIETSGEIAEIETKLGKHSVEIGIEYQF